MKLKTLKEYCKYVCLWFQIKKSNKDQTMYPLCLVLHHENSNRVADLTLLPEKKRKKFS